MKYILKIPSEKVRYSFQAALYNYYAIASVLTEGFNLNHPVIYRPVTP